jgi:hypothetical protein
MQITINAIMMIYDMMIAENMEKSRLQILLAAQTGR